MNQVKLGFIGFGEAAFGIAGGLKDCGLDYIVAYDSFYNQAPAGELIRKRAADSGVTLLASAQELAAKSEVIIASVIARVAVDVAQTIVPYLTESHIYVDSNAASPMVKEEIGQIIMRSGAQFVDAALMGPIPSFLNKVPVLASGNGAEAFGRLMGPYKMNITCLGEKPGQASAIKMFRSIFMKGYVALLWETLDAANKYKAADLVMKSIAETMDKASFAETAQLLVARGLIHAERRAFEMKEVLKTLEEISVSHIMSMATQKKLEWCAQLQFKEYFSGKPPSNLAAVLDAFNAKGI
jgi:3-hydroxyisobutyrate dehydrogenase-like beta-hydroxyacid dehydrogenase